MSDFLSYTIFGLVLAAIYAVAASGLVVTYTTTGMFNFAHGAVGMISAYMFWQLRVGWGLPMLPSVLLILVVAAPLMGVIIDRVIMRGLEGVSEVTKVVVSIGLLFGLISLAPIIWSPKRSGGYASQAFFGGSKIDIGSVGVTYHQIIAIVIAIIVAVALRLFLFGTRAGVSMRAVVDNRSLARLNGARPAQTSALSWALGCSLAAMAGILIQERIGFDAVALTFLVVSAYSAAVVGRLTSLPYTFLGAVVLGLVQSYAQGYVQLNPQWAIDAGIDIATPLRQAIPVIMLFVTLLLLPNAPLRTHGLVRSRESVPRPTWQRAGIGFGILIVAAFVLSRVLGETDLIGWNRGIALGIIMLSLVPLTGYGGQISLAQMSFAGIGAFVMAHAGANGSPLGLLLAVVVSGAVGAIVALPALRLRGIYLALATLAFSYFVDKVVFQQRAFVEGGSMRLERLHLGPITFETSQSYMVFLAVMFSVVGAGIVFLRLGPFGRRLQAMKDSPAACATLGLNLTITKMQVFILSAAIAGLGGALFAGVGESASINDFNAIQNLPLLLMAVAGGIAMVSGALFGGLLLASFPIITRHLPPFEIAGIEGKVFVGNLLSLAPALMGISLGRNPNGAVNDISTRVREAGERRRAARDAGPTLPSPESLGASIDLETLGIDRPFTAADLHIIDAGLGLDEDSMAHARPGATRSGSGVDAPAGDGVDANGGNGRAAAGSNGRAPKGLRTGSGRG
jgi:branched-chain amino acid transport system permease protein